MSNSQDVPPPTMPKAGDLDGTWRYIEWGLDRIMLEGSDSISLKIYMNLYSLIHRYCVHGLNLPFKGKQERQKGVHLLGEELYQKLDDYLKAYTASVHARMMQHAQGALLEVYAEEWKRYAAAAKSNDHLFRFLNRHWVKREQDEGREDVFDIYDLHLLRWTDEVVSAAADTVNLVAVMAQLAEKQNDGDSIETGKIDEVLDSFVLLGVEGADDMKSTLASQRSKSE